MPVRFRAVHPSFYDVEAVVRASEKQVDEVARKMVDDFRKTTRTWEHKVVFGVTVLSRGGEHLAAVGTNDEIYRYVDQGTRPHEIRARRKKFLAYRKGGFRAKTTPRKLSSSSGARATGPLRRPKAVMHPGTDAREFSKEVAKKWRNPSARLIQEAITDAIKRLVKRF